MYDVIVVGARVAGSSTAMLLAGKGLKVLVVDRAAFPSDTLSTHQVQLPGGARLRRWGLLDAVVASGAPPARRARFDAGPVVLDGHFPGFQGVDAVYSPRRTVLDALLVEAARAAGAEVREQVVVEEVVVSGGRVTGIRGRAKGGAPVAESARLTVGADGKHSLVARTVGTATHPDRPPLSMGCYTYWEGVPLQGGELYARPRRAMGAWPTNDGLTMAYVAWPVEEFPAFRADVEGNVLRTLDLAGDLGQRVRAGRRAERFRAVLPMYEFTTELASFAPPTAEQEALFAALAGRQAETDRFFGVLTGAVPLADYMSARNLLRLLGPRATARLAIGRRRALRPTTIGWCGTARPGGQTWTCPQTSRRPREARSALPGSHARRDGPPGSRPRCPTTSRPPGSAGWSRPWSWPWRRWWSSPTAGAAPAWPSPPWTPRWSAGWPGCTPPA
jgi:FAD binding domain